MNHLTPETWPRLDAPRISPDGRYVAFVVTVPKTGNTLTIRAVDGAWRRLVPSQFGLDLLRFTEDSRALVFGVGADSLKIVWLGTDSAWSIGGVSGFEMPKAGDGEWLAYELKDSARTLVLRNLHGGVDRRYPNVARCEFSDDGRALVMQAQYDSLSPQLLVWLETATGRTTVVGQALLVGPWMFDDEGKGLAFLVTDSLGGAVRYYAPGMNRARTVVDASTPGLNGFVVNQLVRVNRGGQDVFVNIAPRQSADAQVPRGDDGASVRIVSTRDEERAFGRAREPLLAVAHSAPMPNVVRLQQVADRDLDGIGSDGAYVVFESEAYGRYDEYESRVTARPNVYLVATRDGSRTLLRRRFVRGGGAFHFSRSSKYVMWHDARRRAWYTYDIARGVTRNITRGIPATMEYPDDHPDVPWGTPDLVGWLADDERVLIQSWYDIWAVDPDGKHAPINLTRGVGTRRHIRFRCVDYGNEWAPSTWAKPSHVFHWGDTLVLSATNERTKANGFYRMVLGKPGELTPLRMDNHVYSPSVLAGNIFDLELPYNPVKALRATRYVVMAESATEYPNYYVTADFRDLTPITQFAPQKAYNWYRTELLRWRLPDGHPGDGVLYKPEDFDAHKRYPVIIYYYEGNPDGLNCFVHPQLSTGPLNVAWFVSNGYLVFVPDIIYYDRGHPGRSALNVVESGAAYLARFPWVDAHKMGIQGHSYGGFETYYIVAHSSRFAAAAAAEGVTDAVSAYTLGYGPWWYERRQGRIGATLWERPDLYIENSPIFSANRTTTPLLMLANAGDLVVQSWQGREMLVALERLGKAAWLLDYKSEGHTLDNKKDQLDYSIRLGQFFDHYLKGEPPPLWMTMSRAELARRGDGGFELDTSGSRP